MACHLQTLLALQYRDTGWAELLLAPRAKVEVVLWIRTEILQTLVASVVLQSIVLSSLNNNWKCCIGLTQVVAY